MNKTILSLTLTLLAGMVSAQAITPAQAGHLKPVTDRGHPAKQPANVSTSPGDPYVPPRIGGANDAIMQQLPPSDPVVSTPNNDDITCWIDLDADGNKVIHYKNTSDDAYPPGTSILVKLSNGKSYVVTWTGGYFVEGKEYQDVLTTNFYGDPDSCEIEVRIAST